MIGEWKRGGSSLLSLIGMGNSARTAVPSRCSGWFRVWKSAWGDLLGMLNKESHHYLWSGKSILISVNILLLSFLSSAFDPCPGLSQDLMPWLLISQGQGTDRDKWGAEAKVSASKCHLCGLSGMRAIKACSASVSLMDSMYKPIITSSNGIKIWEECVGHCPQTCNAHLTNEPETLGYPFRSEISQW